MNKLAATILSLLFAISGLAQDLVSLRDYQSNSNAFYWKNRKPNAAYWQQDVHYKIDAVVNDQVQSVEGREELHYWNNSPDTLYEVYFHLYQNAFTPNSYLHNTRKHDKIRSTFGEHEAKGLGTAIHELKINGSTMKPEFDNSIMRVQLEKPLLPNSGLKVNVHFTTYWDKNDEGNIRRRMKTFRHGGEADTTFIHFDGVHWYPRICVYDRKFGWTTDQHLGKEFYGDYGIFDVSLDFPTQYIVEATGELTNRAQALPDELRQRIDISNFKTERDIYTDPIKADGSRRVWKYHAENVHDFAFTADPTYRIGEVEWNGVKCIALAQEEHAHRWQKTAQFVADVVKTYSTDIGMYAYPKIVAADARDGMEYPMITLNSGNWPGHQYVIAHEVGHNWFFGMIGNNETYRASLDEGFTQFLTSWSLRNIREIKDRPNSIDDGTVYNGYMSHATGANTARLNIHSDHFNSAARHGGGYGQVYYKTATMLYNLQYVLGDELFLSAMKHYFNSWKICHPYWEDFRDAIIQHTKVDLNWFFDSWIESNETIDYKVKSVKKGAEQGQYLITFKRNGMQMPIDFTVTDVNGDKHDFHIPNTYFVKNSEATVLDKWTGWGIVNPEYTAEIRVPAKLKDVQIDASGRLADVYRLDNSKKLHVEWKFDNMRYKYSGFRTYRFGWRPDLWYNALDGIKAGLHVNGDYYKTMHQFKAWLWYNTGVTAHDIDDSTANLREQLSYRVDYSNKINPNLRYSLSSRWISGYEKHGIEFTGFVGSDRLTGGMYAANRREGAYLLQRQFVNDGWDNSLYLKYAHGYKYFAGRGTIELYAGNSSAFSDYRYSELSMTVTNSSQIAGMQFRTRAYAVYMDGSDYAPESLVLLSGANNRELMDNKYTRAAGWFPEDWTTYSSDFNHFHHGGGLNIRGFSGYIASNTDESDTFAIFAGTRGASVNAELSASRWMNKTTGKLSRYVNIDPYLFCDAGILGNDNDQYSDLRLNAGFGTAFTLRSRRYNKTRPLIIRIDLPLFLNRVPEDQEYLGFRYLVGVNRAF